MQILNASDNITTFIPKITETPDTFVINAHIYDKPSLKPIPLEFFTNGTVLGNTPYSCLNNCIWTLDNYYATVSAGTYTHMFLHYGNNNQKIFQDTTNSNVFYNIIRNGRDSYNNLTPHQAYITKYNKNNNNIQYITRISGTNNAHSYKDSLYQIGNDFNILYQTDLYIVYVRKYPIDKYSAAKSCGYDICKFNKQTNSVKVIVTYADYMHNIQFLEYDEKNDNIYLYDNLHHWYDARYSTNVGNCYKILKINLSSDIVTEIANFLDNLNVYIVDNPVKINDYYYVLKDHYFQTSMQSTDKHIYCFHKFKLDTSNDTIEQEIINVDYNIYEWNLNGIGNNGCALYHTLKTINVNNENYIVCTLHSIANANYYPEEHKNIVFKIMETVEIKEKIEIDEETGEEIIIKEENTIEKAIITDMIPFKNGCKGVLEYIDTNTLVMLFNDGMGFYKFDNTQGKYIECYRKGGIFNTIGFDTLNRLYLQYSNGDVEIMTSLNACILKVDFTEEYYRTINTDTEIHYYAKNFLDEYLSTDVIISLIGPVQFKDDSSKEKIIKTSGEGIDSLPITITGSGRIEVIINQYVQ